MPKPEPLNISVCAVIDASPQDLYDLIADVTQMHRYSPENTGAT